MRNYLLMVLAGFLLFFLIGSLSSCSYSYKVKYIEDNSVVILQSTDDYNIGDTINVYTNFYNDKPKITGVYNDDKNHRAVIIPFNK